MTLKISTFRLFFLLWATVLAISACTTHEELSLQTISETALETQSLTDPLKTGNWAKFAELPNPTEKQTTWYLNYDLRRSHVKNASTRKGRLLIQPYNQITQHVENTSSTIEININCYERRYFFGIIRVYAQAYAQGHIIEQSSANSTQNFASAYNPINTGIINFYCKD